MLIYLSFDIITSSLGKKFTTERKNYHPQHSHSILLHPASPFSPTSPIYTSYTYILLLPLHFLLLLHLLHLHPTTPSTHLPPFCKELLLAQFKKVSPIFKKILLLLKYLRRYYSFSKQKSKKRSNNLQTPKKTFIFAEQKVIPSKSVIPKEETKRELQKGDPELEIQERKDQ